MNNLIWWRKGKFYFYNIEENLKMKKYSPLPSLFVNGYSLYM